MKSALAGLAMLGTAGGLSIVLPDATAPYRVAHAVVTLPETVDATPDQRGHVVTYAARTRMTESTVAAWARQRGRARNGPVVILLYDAGSPVPDPSGAQTLDDALWIAERGAPRWRIEITPDGGRTITETGAF